MARPFSFDNAAFHFARADGPPGFLGKYLTAYAVGVLIICVIGFYTLRPLIEGYVQIFALLAQSASEARIEREMTELLTANMGRLGFGYLALMLVCSVFWAMMESAVLRRYVREEGFSIGWGGDEWRMLGLAFFWVIAVLVAYFAFVACVIAVMIPFGSSIQSDPGIIVLIMAGLMLGLGFLWAYAAVKLSPAGALTIRDRKLAFFSAWGATKGRFWPMFGAFALVGLILYVGVLLLYMIGGFVVFGSAMSQIDFSNGEADPQQVLAVFTNPAIWGPAALLYFLMFLYQGVCQYAWAGIPALAAKTDPRGGTHDAAQTFA